MEQPFAVDLGDGAACAVRVGSFEALDEAVRLLGLHPRPVLVLVGGASEMDDLDLERLDALFVDVLAPLAARLALTVVDGGTDAGMTRA